MNNSSSGLTHPLQQVRVSAPARLHLGFLDLNGEIGRKFGSIGVAVNSHYTTIEVCAAQQTTFSGVTSPHCQQRLQSLYEQFYNSLGQAVPQAQRQLAITLREQIPEHAGLGSGTQLALTLGQALCEYHAIDADIRTIAAALGRGKRSGIGITTFEKGGFVIDGGVKPGTTVPPMLMHHYFPQDWRIVMIMDQSQQGVHGHAETHAFKALPLFPQSQAQAICHLTLMQLLPALIEHDIDQFGQAITAIQQLIGDHFAATQGGRYTSKNVARLLECAHSSGYPGIAQSSWGPTGCIFTDSDSAAAQLIDKLTQFAESKQLDIANLSLLIAEADQSGATIETTALQSL